MQLSVNRKSGKIVNTRVRVYNLFSAICKHEFSCLRRVYGRVYSRVYTLLFNYQIVILKIIKCKHEKGILKHCSELGSYTSKITA